MCHTIYECTNEVKLYQSVCLFIFILSYLLVGLVFVLILTFRSRRLLREKQCLAKYFSICYDIWKILKIWILKFSCCHLVDKYRFFILGQVGFILLLWSKWLNVFSYIRTLILVRSLNLDISSISLFVLDILR